MSRMAGHSMRSAAPALPGERASQGVFADWILPSLSLLLGAVLAGNALAGPAPAAPAIPAAVRAPVEEALRAACGCEQFAVRWSIPPAVTIGALALDSLSAVPEATALYALADSAAASSGAGADRVPVRLRGRRGGRVIDYLTEVEPLCRGTVLTIRHAVRAGTVLRADDLEPVEGWYPPSAWRGAVSSAVGKAARIALAPGRPLRRADISEPALVRRGAVVRVLCRLGGIAIEGQGAARKDGGLGERVAVRLAGASRDCLGVVTGPGEVRVDGEGGGS
jgi:flagellar basal body P-ring formation protein FlgA